jgi:GDSL-like lipase/acylhydrolase family protein
MAILASPRTSWTGTAATRWLGTAAQTIRPRRRWLLLLGDSKTAPNPTHPEFGSNQGWQDPLIDGLARVAGGTWDYYNCGLGSQTVASYLATIAQRLSGPLASNLGTPIPMPPGDDGPAAVLINLGVNDAILGVITSQATWQANVLGIIDAVRATWATAPCYVMRWWARDHDADADLMDGWVPALLASRSNAFLGPGERVVLKGADNGATNTYDGIHMGAAGHLAVAAAWQTTLWP